MGSRYGVRTRRREQEALQLKNAIYACPKCGKKKVRRAATALWKCSSCGAEIAGGAYSLSTQLGTTAKKSLTGKVAEK